MMKFLKYSIGVAVIAALGGLAFLYSGVYPMGADVPHNSLTYWALETLRERSVARASRDIEVPALVDPQMLLSGGADYNEMCSGCHSKPGKTASDISAGLYPQPPNLTQGADAHGHEHGGDETQDDGRASAARQFWIIKHGIKASGMAAFGPTHDDERIWAMVAFLQKLPTLSPSQYQILTARRGMTATEAPQTTRPPALSESARTTHADDHHH